MSVLRSIAVAAAVAVLAGCPPGGLSGTYEAQQPDGTMTLEFRSGGKVHMTMREAGGQPDTSTVDFLVDGNNITIQSPGGMPLVLVRDGSVLQANMMGQILRFEKK